MNYILGSGIVGLIAKHLLGDDWQVIPYYKSRFFTTNPPLDDNFLVKHDRLDEIIQKLLPSRLVSTTFYKRAWSVNGQLYTNSDGLYIKAWLQKVFGDDEPGHAYSYYHKKDIFQIYNNIRISEIYNSLLDKYIGHLKENIKIGQPLKIREGYIYFNEGRKPYDKIISTIPAPALYELTGRKSLLKAKDVHYLHLYSDELDFEGANQVLVADSNIEFYKAVNIAPSRYLLYFLNDIQHPGNYMQKFLKNFEIIDGTMVKQALMMGDSIDVKIFNQDSIYPVGGYAIWDYCLDVGSCILRLLNVLDNGR